MASDRRAREAYGAHTAALGGIPRWSELDDATKAAWRAAAAALVADPEGSAKPREFGAGHGRVTRFDEGEE